MKAFGITINDVQIIKIVFIYLLCQHTDERMHTNRLSVEGQHLGLD